MKTISILVAVTSYTAHGLSITTKSLLSPISLSSTIHSPTRLQLGPIDDLSDYGKQKNESELDTLRSKREQLKKAKLANIKPNDDEPKVKDMTDDEIAAMFANKSSGEDGSEEGGMDVDALFARDYVPDFKIKRQSSSRGLSSGDSGGVLDDPNAEDENDVGLFIDWTEDYNDENELHIPNRIGFTTVDWGNGKKGFVSGKLKKKDRKMGKFNKTDLRVSYLCMSSCVCMRCTGV